MIKTRLRLNIQWVYNKISYYDDIHTKIDEYIGSLNQDYLDFEYDLTVINEPFNNILVGKY